jgi:hypothetical protein
MRIMAMRWAVPALGPLVWGAHGHTDYAAHLGGALGGAAIGVLLLAIWDGVSFRPPHGRAAGLFAALFLLGSASGIGFAAAGYNKVRAASAQFIPLSESPANLDVGAEKAGDFLRRYPDDPRSHLFGAMAALKRGEGFVAEEQLRRTLAMATKPEQEVLRHLASGVLAAVYAERHDWRQVKLYGREVCDEKRMEPDMVQLRKMLKKAKACL